LKASYALICRARKPIIDAGGKVEIEIYITGYGHVEKNKLLIHPTTALLRPDDPGKIEYCIDAERDHDSGKLTGRVSAGANQLTGGLLESSGSSVVLNQGNFMDNPTQVQDHHQTGLPQIMAELICDKNPPILVTVNSPPDIHPGDYKVFFTLTYSDGEDIAFDQKEVTIHVRTWTENHQKVVAIALIASVISIFGLLQGIIVTLLPGHK